MKNLRSTAVVYERPGPVSDMFVPRYVSIASIVAPIRRTPRFFSVLMLLITAPTLLYQGSTLSFFSDSEVSTGNTFAAGPLDFTVSPDHPSATLIAGQTGETFVMTLAPGAGSLPFQYKVSGAASGNAAFCAAITASGGAPLPFSGSAGAISTADTASLSPWSLTLTLPSGAPGVVDGQMCILDLTYQGYQEGGIAGTEYHDTEHVILTLTADPPLIPPPPSVSQTVTTASIDEGTTTAATTTEEITPPTDPPVDVSQAPSDSATSTSSVSEDTVAPPPPPDIPPAPPDATTSPS